MSSIPTSPTEYERLAVLDGYRILDTPNEAGFDDAVILACQICETPMALVSFVGADRQWFKARIGLDACETPIERSVCAHALPSPELLVIPDLRDDERTRDNALVTGEPFIRFYAGAPLRTASGVALGTICVIDTEPRPQGLSIEQANALEALARQVMVLLEYRRMLRTFEVLTQEQSQRLIDSIARANASDLAAEGLRIREGRIREALEAGHVGSFEIDVAADTITMSEQFCSIFGLPLTLSLPATAIEALVYPDDRTLMSDHSRRMAGSGELDTQYRIFRADTGELRWIARRGQYVRDETGKPLRLIGTVQDVTDRKEIETRQKLLNDELGHRIKNTLAMVQAIARQTLRNAADRPAVDAFEQRVNALSHAHEILLRQSWLGADMRELALGVLSAHGDPARFRVDGPQFHIGARSALSLSLLLHELATNALKYGALSVPQGYVDLTWSVDGETFRMVWAESGGPPSAEPTKTGLGSRLIDMGLAGTGRTIRRYKPSGIEVEISAPLASLKEHS